MRKRMLRTYLAMGAAIAMMSLSLIQVHAEKIAVQRSATPEIESEESAVEESVPEPITVTISFAGDCTLGSDLRYGKSRSFMEVFERSEDPYGYFFENVAGIFADDDLTVVNLEGPLTNAKSGADKEFVFKGLPEFTNILQKGSVELVNLANNHSLDYGKQGYADTVKHLDEAGIASYGVDKPYYAEVKGLTVAALGYTGWSASAGLKNQIAQDIAATRAAGAKIVMVTFHWGIERDNYPNETQKTLGRFAIDSGADLVVGHHPHVIQGIEQYQGKNIVYSLGNFSFGGNRNPSDKDTFIYRQSFTFDADTLERVADGQAARIIPCSVSSVGSYNDYRPTPLTGGDAQRVVDRLTKYSRGLNGEDIIVGMWE